MGTLKLRSIELSGDEESPIDEVLLVFPKALLQVVFLVSWRRAEFRSETHMVVSIAMGVAQ